MKQHDAQPRLEQILELISLQPATDVDSSLFHAELTGCVTASMTRDGQLIVAMSARCHSERLGNGVARLRHRVDLPSWNVTEGVFMLTSNAGGTIRGIYQASGVPRPNVGVRFTGFWSFTRGTGALAGISGGGVATGTIYADRTCFIALDGMVRCSGAGGAPTTPCAR